MVLDYEMLWWDKTYFISVAMCLNGDIDIVYEEELGTKTGKLWDFFWHFDEISAQESCYPQLFQKAHRMGFEGIIHSK